MFGGPIVSTSLNRAGEEPISDYAGAQEQFGAELDFVLPGQTAGATGPSKHCKQTAQPYANTVLRRQPVSEGKQFAVLGNPGAFALAGYPPALCCTIWL